MRTEMLQGTLTYSSQLAGVVGVAVRSAGQPRPPGHGVQSLREVGRSLQHDLLGQPLRVSGVAGHQLGEPGEAVVYAWLL